MGKALDPGYGISGRESETVPDTEGAAAVLPLWIGAVLREVSGSIQGTVVEAMTVRVAGSERQPVRSPLGQGGLQAVVVGTAIVRDLVDKIQPWELAGIRLVAICITLIEVAKTRQS